MPPPGLLPFAGAAPPPLPDTVRKTEVEIECGPEKLATIAEMDNPASMDDLAEIGAKAAANAPSCTSSIPSSFP